MATTLKPLLAAAKFTNFYWSGFLTLDLFPLFRSANMKTKQKKNTCVMHSQTVVCDFGVDKTQRIVDCPFVRCLKIQL